MDMGPTCCLQAHLPAVDADPQGRQFAGHDAGEGMTSPLGGAVPDFYQIGAHRWLFDEREGVAQAGR
jgi:hypothetical protein